VRTWIKTAVEYEGYAGGMSVGIGQASELAAAQDITARTEFIKNDVIPSMITMASSELDGVLERLAQMIAANSRGMLPEPAAKKVAMAVITAWLASTNDGGSIQDRMMNSSFLDETLFSLQSGTL